ncbi:LAGLIDADG-like domain protein [uncultured archaeon]|nr:LAGLIDADG-like domain protein [uncultured archaeon]
MRGSVEVNLDKLSQKETGYLVGCFIGDGYANYNKKDRHYHVEFHFNSIRDVLTIRYVSAILNTLGLRCFLHNDKRYKATRVRVNSRSLMRFLQEERSRIINASLGKEYALGLISGFIDAEGYVGNGEILVTQRDKGTLMLFKNICESLSVPTKKFWSSKNYKSKSDIWRLRISTSFKYLPHNSHKVREVYGGSALRSGVEIYSNL